MRSIGIQCQRAFLCYEKCKLLKEKDFRFYTGLSQELFEVLYEFLGGDKICCKLKYTYDPQTPKRQQFQGDLSSKDKLFMTLLRLRHGIPLRDLKVLFDISEGHASKCFFTWVRFMSLEFKKLEKGMFLCTAAQNNKRPPCFKMFENLRGVIDTTEFKMQRPRHMEQNTNTFSAYKNWNTMKFLYCISCFGGLSFISHGYEGSMSDRKVVLNSKFLDHLDPGDGIMADKGFDIEDCTDPLDVDLYIPSFIRGRSAFTGRELLYSRAIAEGRIHVERFIGRVKEFRLIRYMIPNSVLPLAEDLVRVCSFLVNFQSSLVVPCDEDDL